MRRKILVATIWTGVARFRNRGPHAPLAAVLTHKKISKGATIMKQSHILAYIFICEYGPDIFDDVQREFRASFFFVLFWDQFVDVVESLRGQATAVRVVRVVVVHSFVFDARTPVNVDGSYRTCPLARYLLQKTYGSRSHIHRNLDDTAKRAELS